MKMTIERLNEIKAQYEPIVRARRFVIDKAAEMADKAGLGAVADKARELGDKLNPGDGGAL